MTIKKRGDTYWIDVTINGNRIRESLRTTDPKQAKELHDIRRGELWRSRLLKEKPKKTWNDATDKWKIEKAAKRSISDDQDKITFLKPKLGNKLLTDIDRDAIEEALPEGVKPATRNRYRALIRAIFRAAQIDWQWIDSIPGFRREEEPTRRVAYLTREQAESVIANLPVKYRCAVRFALLTGLRKANVFGLRWENVNLETGMVIVHADEAKAGERILVPLNKQARELLAAFPEPREGLVFQCPVRISPTTWSNATKRAGVPWCRFHDLRHTWASWHAMAGTPMSVLQELGGWHSAEMVRKYAHLSPEHLAAAAEKVTF